MLLATEHSIPLLRQFLFSTPYLRDTIFSGIVWTNRLDDFDEGICFLKNSCYGNW